MTTMKGRARARPSSRGAAICVVLLAVGFSACRSPGETAKPSPDRRVELGEPAARLPSTDDSTPGDPLATTTTGIARPSGTPEPTSTTSASGPAALTATTTVPPTGQQELAAIADDSDVVTGPGYADLRGVRVSSSGSNLKVEIDVGGAFPAFKAREVLGIGFDVHRSSDQESDYQLFADGGVNGWRAYLQTPEGFVEYPGSFAIGTSRLQFDVPWTAVGGRSSFRMAVFADWSSQETLVPTSSNDYAPDSGTSDVALPRGGG